MLQRLYKIALRQQELLRYIWVGGMSQLIDIAVFGSVVMALPEEIFRTESFLLVEDYHVAQSISFVMVTLFNFTAHKYFTFESKIWNRNELIKYLILLGFNFIAGMTVITFASRVLLLSDALAKLLSIIVIVSWNYMLMKNFVYSK